MSRLLRIGSKSVWLLVFTSFFISACGDEAANETGSAETYSAADSGWVSLFNGEDLSQWIVKLRGFPAGLDPLETFRVKNGAIVVDYQNYDGHFEDRFGHLFHTTPYSSYRLALDYRFTGEQIEDGPGWAFRNSGIMVHSQFPGSMGVDQDFPISIEVQLLGGDEEGERSTANLCTPGTNVVMDGELETRHCINSSSSTYRGDDWVHVEVLVLSDSLIVHYINGQEVLRYEHPQMGGGAVSGHDASELRDGEFMTGGYISVQSESHPVEFRNIRLRDLSQCVGLAPANGTPVAEEPDYCRFER